jgi:hypothetical protein
VYSQIILLTLEDISGVLLSSKHSGGKYLQIKEEKKEDIRGFIKANVERSWKHETSIKVKVYRGD